MNATLIHSLGIAFLLVSCAGGSGGSSTTSSSSSALTQPLTVTAVEDVDGDADDDAQAPSVTSVVITVSRIDARVVDETDDDHATWTTVSTKVTTLDLLSLQGTTFASLGVAALPAGGIDRLRLFIDTKGPNFVKTPDGMAHVLVVPSDVVRVVGDLDDLGPCTTGTVTLQFAGRRSVHVDPIAGGQWELRPVVRAKEVVTAGTCPPAEDEGSDDQGHGHGGHGQGENGQ